MAQTPCLKIQSGESIPDPTTTTRNPGDVYVMGSIPFVVLPCDPNQPGLNSLDGVNIYDVPKDSSTFSAGDAVYWNATGNPLLGTAGTGCATSTASGNVLMGFATKDAATGVNYVRTKLSAAKRTATIAGSVTADDITGSDSSLGINGQSAAQGGAIALTGGTSSTAGNAGGAITITGGTPGITGVGGAVTITGGAGGATSGNGGAVSSVGGAGTNGNGVGGANTSTGGAGNGSGAGGASGLIGGAGGATGAGGAITITSGAGGASSGAAGAVNISVGSATSANGASVTITAGNGAGGTNAGGHVNLVPGTAVSTGTPGEFRVNGDANMIFVQESLSATDASRAIFVANRAMILKSVKAFFSTASSSGTLTVEKLTGTTAAGSGTALLTGTMSLSGTTNTVVSGTLISTIASLTFAAGDRLGVVVAGTMSSLANCKVVCGLAPL
jgi:hypothetical protein